MDKVRVEKLLKGWIDELGAPLSNQAFDGVHVCSQCPWMFNEIRGKRCQIALWNLTGHPDRKFDYLDPDSWQFVSKHALLTSTFVVPFECPYRLEHVLLSNASATDMHPPADVIVDTYLSGID